MSKRIGGTIRDIRKGIDQVTWGIGRGFGALVIVRIVVPLKGNR